MKKHDVAPQTIETIEDHEFMAGVFEASAARSEAELAAMLLEWAAIRRQKAAKLRFVKIAKPKQLDLFK